MSSSQYLAFGYAGERDDYGIASYVFCAPPNHTGICSPATPITVPFRDSTFFSFFLDPQAQADFSSTQYTYFYFAVYDF